MGLKINFKFQILEILVQNPNIQQVFFFQNPHIQQAFFLFKIPIFSRREVPPASLARSVLKPCAPTPCELTYPRLVLHVLCWSRVHISRVRLTATPLTWTTMRSMVMTYLPPEKVSLVFMNYKMNLQYFWKICEKLFFTEKKSDFKLKIGGFFGKKNLQIFWNFGHNWFEKR